jgi:1-deoxy-D-xylulose-5-phosphate synthase
MPTDNNCNHSEDNKILDKISLPQGLRQLSTEQLEIICRELRAELISTVSESGGHFASSLGATEISVALHYSLNTPHDRIVWDVGHQAYIHKMLTGRRHMMKDIRKQEGISGFLKRSESEYDCFGAGHAGTSISAAVGMSTVLQSEKPDNYVAAVIGDASISAGMAYEALNNAGALRLKNFIVILNDNEMSISPNVGALSWLFSHAVTSKTSNLIREQFKGFFKKGYVPEVLYKAVDRVEELTQGFFSSASMLFEAFGFRYIGPVNGNNVAEMVTALEHAKSQDVPVLIHAYTQKGKGYQPAEQDPVSWHGVVPFDAERGEFIASTSKKPPTFTAVFSSAVCELAQTNPKIVAITAGMSTGTGLDKFNAKYPARFFDVGICEQHGVTFAAGMACEGLIPICAIYSTFLQRAYDQVVHDVCIQNLPVIFAMDRGGLVGNDGETHQGLYDIAFLRTLPNITLMSPKDERELRDMLYTASKLSGPSAIRYPRGNGFGVEIPLGFSEIEIGKAEILLSGKDVVIFAFGPLVYSALEIADRLAEFDISTTVVNARFAKPLDSELINQLTQEHSVSAVIEDHALAGGFSSAVLESLNDAELIANSAILRFGIKDILVPHATQEQQQKINGMDKESVLKEILAKCLSLGIGNASKTNKISASANL